MVSAVVWGTGDVAVHGLDQGSVFLYLFAAPDYTGGAGFWLAQLLFGNVQVVLDYPVQFTALVWSGVRDFFVGCVQVYSLTLPKSRTGDSIGKYTVHFWGKKIGGGVSRLQIIWCMTYVLELRGIWYHQLWRRL